MIKDEEDDNIWGLEDDDDKLSIEFTFDQSIRIKVLPLYFNRNLSSYYHIPTFYIWPEFFHFLKKVVCTPFRNLHFCSFDLNQTKTFYLIMLNIFGVAFDQVCYELPPFYNKKIFIIK